MLEILQFIFSSFWVWLGFTINFTILLYIVALFAGASMTKNASKDNDKDKD